MSCGGPAWPAPEILQVLVGALRAAVALVERSAQAAEEFALEELYSELSEAYERLERTEDALAAMGRAIAAGYRRDGEQRTRQHPRERSLC